VTCYMPGTNEDKYKKDTLGNCTHFYGVISAACRGVSF